GEIAPETAPQIDHANRRAGHVAEDRRSLPALGFLEYQLIGAQPERIARQFQRHMITAAELELRRGVEVALRQIGRQLELSTRKNIGGDGDDDGLGPELTFRRVDLDTRAAPPFDGFHRRCKQERERGRKLREQRAISLTAEGAVVALARTGEIGRRNLRELLAAAVG